MLTSDEEDDWECPLCLEEMDISDRNFKPCPCGYQICRFCYNHIKENLNKRCPACRREYSDLSVQFTPLTPAEISRLRNEKKQKEREKREMEANNRRHLDNMRVVQKNLVYVVGLSSRIANEELLRQPDYFGQFGRVNKVVVNRKSMGGYGSQEMNRNGGQESIGVYVTYGRRDDALKCIYAVDGTVDDGKIIKASFGTTKYCSFYLRGLSCQNPGCMYLHELGDPNDSYTKEEMAIGKHHSKIHPNHLNGTPPNASYDSNVALGPPAPFGVNAGTGQLPPTGDEAPKTPSKSGVDSAGLPRSAAWASRAAGGSQQSPAPPPVNSTIAFPPPTPASERKRRGTPEVEVPVTPVVDDRIECSVFDDIYPDPVRSAKLAVKPASTPDDSSLINTAMLHRYFVLAQQAREYYLQLSAQLLQSMDGAGAAGGSGGAGTGASGALTVGNAAPAAGASPFLFDPFREEDNKQEKSRFGFAQQMTDLTERFGAAMTGMSGAGSGGGVANPSTGSATVTGFSSTAAGNAPGNDRASALQQQQQQISLQLQQQQHQHQNALQQQMQQPLAGYMQHQQPQQQGQALMGSYQPATQQRMW